MTAPGPTSRARPTVGGILGELLLTAGVLILLFVVYEAFWTNLAAGRLQSEANAGLEESWDDDPGPGTAHSEPVPPPVAPLGQAFARVHLPTLGTDAVFAAVEGTRDEDLRTGPGRYPHTQMPGERGNFALAGHRNGSGAVFQHVDRLETCDAIVVETESQWMTYRLLPVGADSAERHDAARQCLSPEQTERVTVGDYAHVRGRHVTVPDDVGVVDPLPGAAGNEAARDEEPEHGLESGHGHGFESGLERMLTLTTCHPQFSNAERLIVHAFLVETTAKSGDGDPPPALKER